MNFVQIKIIPKCIYDGSVAIDYGTVRDKLFKKVIATLQLLHCKFAQT